MLENKDINKNTSGNGQNFILGFYEKRSDRFVSNGTFFYYLNLQLLQQIGFKTMAFWLKLKSEHVNGTIYDYSNRKIAKIVGCSTTVAKKNIEILEKAGMIRFFGNNITTVKIKNNPNFSHLKQQYTKVLLDKNTSFKDLKDKLALLLIQRKSNQIQYKVKKTTGDRNKNEVSGEIQPERLAIGMRKMSEYLNISLGSLHALLKRLKKLGLKVIQIKETLGKVKGEIYRCAIDGYAFKNKKGIMTIHYGSIYCFNTTTLAKSHILRS